MNRYLFDGTFTGLLTAIYDSYANKHTNVLLIASPDFQGALFDSPVRVLSDEGKARKVWEGLGKKLGTSARHQFYTVFLSEQADAYQQLLGFARYVFDHKDDRTADYGNPFVLAVNDYAKKVSRERHRMKAFVRFNKSADALYFAIVEPDYNVLPLIMKHFADRYADQRWLIFDKRRRYGIYYDLTTVQEVKIEQASSNTQPALSQQLTIDENDALYVSLWQDYFKNTNIKERANLKLHIQHVPKRYWRHLPEKGFGL